MIRQSKTADIMLVKPRDGKQADVVYACKRVDKASQAVLLGAGNEYFNEVLVLKYIGRHSNIVSVVDTFESEDHIWIIMEYFADGDAADQMMAGPMTETEAKQIVRDVLLGLRHCHCRGIVHRDVKLENIMIRKKKNGNIQAKLADFGISTLVRKTARRTVSIGTPGWLAPELIQKSSYTTSVDMWAVGVAAYTLLVGVLPFDEPLLSHAYGKSTNYRVDFDSMRNHSSEAMGFVRRCIMKRADMRMTAEEALAHPWLAQSIMTASVDRKVVVSSATLSSRRKMTWNTCPSDAHFASRESIRVAA